MSNNSVMDEMVAELQELRKQLATIKDGQGFNSKFYILSEAPLKITGVLISEGVWKGIHYKYDELLKSFEKFKDIPLMVMHGKTDEFGNRKVGYITKLGKDDILKAITFEAIVTDEEAAKKVKEKVFDAVSVKGEFGTLDTSSIPPVGLDYRPIEFSLTGSPACDNCYIFSVEELSKSFGNFINTFQVNNIGGDNKMSQDMIEIKENDVLVLPDNVEELEDSSIFECEIIPIEKYLELTKQNGKRIALKVPAGKYPNTAKKIVKLHGYYYPYYGYPYYYYYGYPYYGYYYGYPYYYGKLDEILDILVENESYREFMKKCMKEKGGGPDALKACALEWKKQQGEQQEEMELAGKKIVCPVCGKEFNTFKEFKAHWAEKHESKYGEYGKVKKLVKDILEDKEFRAALKKAIVELENEEAKQKDQENKPKDEPKTEPQQEDQSKDKPTDTKPKEEPKQEPKPKIEDIYSKIQKTPEIAAELLLESVKGNRE